MDRHLVVSPSFLLKPQPARAAAFVVIGHPEAGERGHAAPGIEQDTENGLIPNAFQRIWLDGCQESRDLGLFKNRGTRGFSDQFRRLGPSGWIIFNYPSHQER